MQQKVDFQIVQSGKMIKNNKKILKYMCMAHIMQLKKTFKYIVYVTNCCVKESSRI